MQARQLNLKSPGAIFDRRTGVMTQTDGTTLTLVRIPRGFTVSFHRYESGNVSATWPSKVIVQFNVKEFPELMQELQNWFVYGPAGATK